MKIVWIALLLMLAGLNLVFALTGYRPLNVVALAAVCLSLGTYMGRVK